MREKSAFLLINFCASKHMACFAHAGISGQTHAEVADELLSPLFFSGEIGQVIEGEGLPHRKGTADFGGKVAR